MKKYLSVLLAAFMLFGIASSVLSAEDDNSILLFVSPDGSDSGNGSIDSPFKTIERAQAEVRSLNSDMYGNIVVNLREGDYYLDKTLEFHEEDSGTNGYYVIYRAYNSENVRISGGKKIEGWQPYKDNIWRAEYKECDIVRQLYVNNRRARRAQSETLVKTESFFDDTDTEYVHDGIVINGTDMLHYTNVEDIQLHYVIGWKSYLLNVDAIEKEQDNTRILLQQPAFEKAYDNKQHYIEPGIQFWAENVFEELDEEGEFYYNKSEQMLYYIPRADEDMNNIDAQAAYLEVLMDISGEDAVNRVHNINFEGITFTSGAWKRPSVAGLVNDQAQMMGLDPTDEDGTLPVVPSNIRLNRAEKINFRNNVIRDMGCVGIGLFNGVVNCDFRGNVFCDIADSAMTVGNEFFMHEDDVYTGKNLLCDAKITASSYDGNCYPIYAVNNDNFMVWSPIDNGECWLQADLGEAYEIDRIELEPRPGNEENDEALWGIKILASNYEDFRDYAVIGSSIKSSERDRNGTVIVRTKNPNKFRYVRFAKDYYMCLSNVRVINESMEYSPMTELCKNISIENNYITRIGLVNFGAPGVQAYYTQNTSMCHNEIYYVPYSGLCSGWGWTLYDETSCRDNKISYNRIDECMLVAFDGGATYMLGNQPNSVQIGNYITNQRNDLAALYLDAGSQNFTLKENVLEGVPSSYHCGIGRFNIWEGNYTTQTADSIDFTQCFNSRASRENELYAPGAEPLEVVEIMENSGLFPEFEYIKEKAGENYWEWSRNFMLQNSEIHSGYGDTADAWYNNYYVKFNARSILQWLKLVKVGDGVGMFPVDAVKDMRAFADECLKISEKTPVDRKEITATYWRIVDKVEEFKSKRNKFPKDELIEIAEEALHSATVGSGYGMSTKLEYERLYGYLERAKNTDDAGGIRLLEAAIVHFKNNKINFDIKNFKLNGQIGSAIIDKDAATIEATVKYTTDIKNLTASAELGQFVSIFPNPTSKIDYTNPVTFIVKSKEMNQSKSWKVTVKKEPIINLAEPYRMTKAVQDADGWNTFGANTNRIYMNERYGDITLDFDIEIAPREIDWPCLIFRSQENDQSFDSPTNASYVVVFGKGKLEFYRFNNGKRTQFYGDVPNCPQIFGPTIKTDAFKFGQKNNVQLTTENVDDGVHIKLIINDETVFDFVDNYEGTLTLPGYFGSVSPGSNVNITAD